MRWPVAAGLIVGLVGQFIALTQSSGRRSPAGPAPAVIDLVKGWLFNVPLPVWRPSVNGIGSAFAQHGWPLAVVVTIAVGATAPFFAGIVLNHPPNYAYDSLTVERLATASRSAATRRTPDQRWQVTLSCDTIEAR